LVVGWVCVEKFVVGFVVVRVGGVDLWIWHGKQKGRAECAKPSVLDGRFDVMSGEYRISHHSTA